MNSIKIQIRPPSRFRIIPRSNRYFNSVKKRIIKCPAYNRRCQDSSQQCYNSKTNTSIPSYYIEEAIETADFFLLYESPQKKLDGTYSKYRKRIDGFLFGRIKTIPENKRGVKNPQVFYIDLVCSAHKKGRALLEQAEKYALKKGIRLMGLRAAQSGLIPYYKRLGYKRVANSCRKRRTGNKRVMKRLDVDTDYDGFWMSKCL